MSKRRPTSELTHDNWDQEDNEKETAGEFKQASSDVMQSRKVLSAKRKTTAGSGENAQKTPFAAFKGFSSSTPAAKPNFSFINNSTPANKTNGQEEEKKTSSADDYYHQLKSLNVSVSSWIAKHVQSNPYCILTPVFRDYEKHLTNIEKKKPLLLATEDEAADSSTAEAGSKSEPKAETPEDKKDDSAPPAVAAEVPPSKEEPKVEEKKDDKTNTEEGNKQEAAAGSSIFGSIGTASTFSFGSAKPSAAATPTSFLFGNTNPSTTSLFGSNPSPFGGSSGAPTFGFGSKPAGATFSFGATEPAFSFSNIAKKPEGGEGENAEEGEEAEEPPKVEFNTFKEDDSIFDIKCKMFVLKDREYKERGLGQLFIKKKDAESKAQLLIRSSGATGQILLNVLLNTSLDPKRVGKNNVQMACVALPTDKDPSVVMIRVKTGEDADNLLQKIKDNQK